MQISGSLSIAMSVLALVSPRLGWTASQGEAPGSCWTELAAGMPKQNTGYAMVPPSIDAAGTDRPWVAWSEEDTVTLRRWTGTAWEEIPSPANVRDPVVRIRGDGTAVMAWRAAESMESSIVVARWDGKTWQRLAAPLSGIRGDMTHAGDAAMVLDEAGNPVVAWNERTLSGARGVYAARWDGKQWRQLGKAVAEGSDLYSLEPVVALDSTGSPWIAWAGGTNAESFVRVARWNGKAWVDVGRTASGALRRSMNVRMPQLVLLSGDEALLAWLERGNRTTALELARWTGRAWSRVPAPATAQDPWSPSLVLGPGREPLLGWTESDPSDLRTVTVQRLTAAGWQPLLAKMHLDPGQSDADRVQLSRGAGAGFHAAWDEPAGDGRRTRVIQVRPCAQKEKPNAPPPLANRGSFWPRSVDAAVEQLLATMDEKSIATVRSTSKDKLILFHHGWGTGIRNEFGLWRGNTALLESCGAKDIHPDECSMIIIERVWERLQTTAPDAGPR